MRYYGEEALGLVETLGLVPALEAADKMLKAADVELISYENVGSTLVTIMVKGDVAAVRSAVEAGAEAAARSGLEAIRNETEREQQRLKDAKASFARFFEEARALCSRQLDYLDRASSALPAQGDDRAVDAAVKSIEASVARMPDEPDPRIDISPELGKGGSQTPADDVTHLFSIGGQG